MPNSYKTKRKSAEQKEAFRLYRKHITGRGYAWSVHCDLPIHVQEACLEAIEWGRRNPSTATSEGQDNGT